MTKKINNIDKEIERLRSQKPAILKCSHNLARRIKKEKRTTLINPLVKEFLRDLKIIPSDRIPDHIIFLCDKKGDTLRMVNIQERREPGPIILPGNLKTH